MNPFRRTAVGRDSCRAAVNPAHRRTSVGRWPQDTGAVNRLSMTGKSAGPTFAGTPSSAAKLSVTPAPQRSAVSRLDDAHAGGFCDAMTSVAESRGRKQQSRSFRWGRAIAITVPAAALLAIIALFVGVRRYLHSDAFRNLVERQASRALRADCRLSPVAWLDTTARAAEFRAEGRPGGTFRNLDARDVRAVVALGGLWANTWQVPRVEVETLTLDLAPAGNSRNAGENEPAAVADPPARSPGFLARLLPKRVQIDEIAVRTASLKYSSPAQTWVAEDVALNLYPRADRSLDIRARNGRVDIGRKPKFALDDLSARLAGGTVFLTHARAHAIDGSTRVDLSGEAGDQLRLRLNLTNLGAAELLSEDWRRRLQGRIQGEATIEGPANDPARIAADGHFTMTEGRLELLPVLDKIATHTHNDGFRSLAINRAETRFHRIGNRLEIRQFSLESSGVLRVQGQCDVVDGRIDGLFEVGVAPGTLRWVPGAESRVFARSENGFLWTTVRIVGPLDSPAEDLSDRLVDAAVAQTIEDAPRKALEAAGKGLDAAANFGDRVIERGSRIIDRGSDVLKGFVPLLK